VNARGRALAVTLLTLVTSCTRFADRGDRDGGPSSRGNGATEEGDRAAPLAAAASTSAKATAANEIDPIARELFEARIIALSPTTGAAWQAGTFKATLEGAIVSPRKAASRRVASLILARDSAPVAYRRPLAFYRLAAALGMRVVPAMVLRRISVGELGALLQKQPAALKMVRREARVQNDGTVDALLAAAAPASLESPWTRPRSVSLDAKASSEVQTWERWAGSPTAVPGESSQLLRDFVEMMALDYLTAMEARPVLLFLKDAGAIVLEDNWGAFPLHPEADAVEQLLHRLRAVARFPHYLRDTLARLDRARAAAVLAPAGFDTWLVPPRSLIDLDERRASLLSLIEAQVEERGAGAVLCL
jgi:hypothetical protein